MKKTKKAWKKVATIDDEIMSSGYKVNDLEILVDQKVYNVMRAAADIAGDDEYSILFKGYWSDAGIMVSEEYYIPKQTISGSSVDYDEPLGILREQQGFNVVLHSHPFTKNKDGWFSKDDMEYINTNFPISLLANGLHEIIRAHVILETPQKGYDIRVELGYGDIHTFSNESMEIVGLDNIRKKKAIFPMTYTGSFKSQHAENHDYFLQDGY